MNTLTSDVKLNILKIAAQLVISDDAPMLTPASLHQQIQDMLRGEDRPLTWDMERRVNGGTDPNEHYGCQQDCIAMLTTQITSRFFRVTAVTEAMDVVEWTCPFDQFGGGQG